MNWVSRWLEWNAADWAPLGSDEFGGIPLKDSIVRIYHRHGQHRLVWDTESYSKTKQAEGQRTFSTARAERPLVGLFNKSLKRDMRGLVLVSSDRLSESVDLHSACNVLIHFDLDWSPLRLIQRVGRLWRIGAYGQPDITVRNKNSKRPTPPRLPAVFHLRYPCSTDDEIHSRLKRRWERLASLQIGLDILSYQDCVGVELGSWGESLIPSAKGR